MLALPETTVFRCSLAGALLQPMTPALYQHAQPGIPATASYSCMLAPVHAPVHPQHACPVHQRVLLATSASVLCAPVTDIDASAVHFLVVRARPPLLRRVLPPCCLFCPSYFTYLWCVAPLPALPCSAA